MTDYFLIPLTQGKIALVDTEDYERVSKFKWHASRSYRRGGIGSSTFYAKAVNHTGAGPARVYLHRVVMCAPPGIEVDHIDRARTLDCRKSNLRLATRMQNMGNQGRRSNATNRYKGVSWNHGKWSAVIKANGKRLFLGQYHSEEDAARAYNAAATLHFGEFALLNVIPPAP